MKLFSAKILSFAALVVAAVMLFLFQPWFGSKEAVSGPADNVSGYAWNDSIGWISFNCTDINDCGADYGVNIDPDTGDLSGYAWNDAVGWISFHRADTGNPPEAPYEAGSGAIAKMDLISGEISGWAKILSLGDGGWIKLRCYEGECGASDYGAMVDLPNGDFSGYGWNDLVGWVSFNCADGGLCGAGEYKVVHNISAHDSFGRVRGFAWSERVGWFSFSSKDCDTNANNFIDGGNCGSDDMSSLVVPYGVRVDPESGDFSGYAWNPDAGWVSFNRNTAGDPPQAPYDSGGGAIARMDLDTGEVSGWAKILSLGDDGWMKLRCDGAECGDSDYGVMLESNAEFTGWAWNGGEDLLGNPTLGIGWVSFNCENEESPNFCGDTSDYKVYIENLNPPAPTIISVEPLDSPPLDGCNTLRVTWNDVVGERGYRLYSSENPGVTESDLLVSGYGEDITFGFETGIAPPGSTRYYRVEAFNDWGAALSDNEMSGTTLTVCGTSINSPAAGENNSYGVCPNTIHLVWAESANADYYLISRCKAEVSGVTCAAWNDSNFIPVNSGACQNPSPVCDSGFCACDDDTIPADEGGERFSYIIAPVDSDPFTIGASSTPSDEIQPCAPLPIWREVKY